MSREIRPLQLVRKMSEQARVTACYNEAIEFPFVKLCRGLGLVEVTDRFLGVLFSPVYFGSQIAGMCWAIRMPVQEECHDGEFGISFYSALGQGHTPGVSQSAAIRCVCTQCMQQGAASVRVIEGV